MTKINLNFGGGTDSIIFSVKKNIFLSYEKDRNAIHEEYGGREEYTSRSGLSGSGYIRGNSDVIQFCTYRTDYLIISGSLLSYRRTPVHTIGEKNIYGFVPTQSHKGIDEQYPVVLTDGNNIVFSKHDEVADWLLQWDQWQGPIEKKFAKDFFATVIEEDLYDTKGVEKTLKWCLINPHHFKKLTARIFLDLAEFQCDNTLEDSLLSRRLSIITKGENLWFKKDVQNILCHKFTEDPRGLRGEIPETGWNGFGNGVIWRRGKGGIEVFAEMRRSVFEDGKFNHPDAPEWLDFEMDFSVLEFFSKTEEEVSHLMFREMRKKAIADLRYCRGIAQKKLEREERKKTLLGLMADNPNKKICIQDSLDTGNCLPGTQAFINRFQIEIGSDGCTTIGKIFENEKIDQMIDNFDFQKVLAKVFEG